MTRARRRVINRRTSKHEFRSLHSSALCTAQLTANFHNSVINWPPRGSRIDESRVLKKLQKFAWLGSELGTSSRNFHNLDAKNDDSVHGVMKLTNNNYSSASLLNLFFISHPSATSIGEWWKTCANAKEMWFSIFLHKFQIDRGQ